MHFNVHSGSFQKQRKLANICEWHTRARAPQPKQYEKPISEIETMQKCTHTHTKRGREESFLRKVNSRNWWSVSHANLLFCVFAKRNRVGNLTFRLLNEWNEQREREKKRNELKKSNEKELWKRKVNEKWTVYGTLVRNKAHECNGVRKRGRVSGSQF